MIVTYNMQSSERLTSGARVRYLSLQTRARFVGIGHVGNILLDFQFFASLQESQLHSRFFELQS